MGDVIAGAAIAAGGGIVEFAIAIDERDRDTVDLWFDSDRDIIVAEAFADALVKLDEFLFRTRARRFFQCLGSELEDIVDREHGHKVAHFFKAFDRLAADTQGGGVRIVQLGVLALEFLELAEKPVVFGIGNFRSCLAVIESVVVLELLAQLLDPLLGRGVILIRKKIRLLHASSIFSPWRISRPFVARGG